MNNTQNNNLQIAADVTKALGLTENGGKVDVNNAKSGESGEMKSIFQYEPGTWQAVSKQIFGKEMPMTSDNETYATLHRVLNWLNKGYTPDQIASMQNAGAGEPDAYNGKFSDGSSSKGTNKYGVKYDVPGYVDKFKTYLDQVSNKESNPSTQSEQPQQETPVQNPITNNVTPGNTNPGMLSQGKAPKANPKLSSGIIS